MAQYLLKTSQLKYFFTSSTSQTVKLVVVRHGESIWNKHRKWAGWTDIRLSSTGKKQSKQCANLLKQNNFLQFDQGYSSVLTRSIQTLNYILDEFNQHYIPVHKSWRLNQKLYGTLTGENKVDIKQTYGEQKVKQWRRSFEVRPPGIDKHDQRHPLNVQRYKFIRKDLENELSGSEHQQDVINRLLPLWQQSMKPKILSHKKLIVCAHGSSIRALVKIISDFSEQQIKQFNIPHAVPLVYTLQINKQKKTIKPLNLEYLGDMDDINAKIARIKNETNKTQM